MKKTRAAKLLAVLLVCLIFGTSISIKATRELEDPAKESKVTNLEEGKVIEHLVSGYVGEFEIPKAEFILFELTTDSFIGKIEANYHFDDQSKSKPLHSTVTTHSSIFFVDKANLKKLVGNEKGKMKVEFKVKAASESGKGRHKFHVLFLTRNLEMIHLPKETTISLPVTLNHPFTVQFDNEVIEGLKGNNEYGADLSVVSKFSPIITKAYLKDGNDVNKITLFISGDASTNNIHIPMSKIKELGKPELSALISFASEETHTGFDSARQIGLYWTRVQLAAKTFKIGSAPMTGYGKENEFVFYSMTKKSLSRSLVTLTVHQGEADLYLLKGGIKYPDTNDWTLKSDSFKDDQVVIPPSNEPNPPEEETWIIGVYSRLNSKYTIRVLENIKYQFLPVEEGQVVKQNLGSQKQLYLLLDIVPFVQKRDFYIGYYGNLGGLSVKAKFFNEETMALGDVQESILKDVELSKNEQPDILLRTLLENAPNKPGTQLLVLITNKNPKKQDITSFVVSSNPTSVIQILGGDFLKDNLTPQKSQRYSFVFGYNILDTKFYINLEQGELDLKITDQENIDLDKNPLVQKLVSSGTSVFKELTLHRSREFMKDAGFFSKLYVHVNCQKSAVFTIGTNKQESHYHRVRPGVQTLIKYKQNHQNNYFLDMEDLQDVQELEIRLERTESIHFAQKEDSSTKAEYENDLIQNMEIKFLNAEQFGKRDPNGNLGTAANIMDKIEIKHEERAYHSYKITPATGYLMITPRLKGIGKDANYEVKVLMQVVLNNLIPMSSNTALSAYISPSQSHLYQINLNKGYIVDLKVSLCTGGEIRATLVDTYKKPIEAAPTNEAKVFGPADLITLNSTQKRNKSYKKIHYENLGEDTTIYLKVESLSKDINSTTSYNIVSDQTRKDDHVSIRDWIYTSYEQYIKEGKQYPFEWEQDPGNITHKFPPILPPPGLLENHPEISMFQVNYVVYMTNQDFGLASMNNTCELDHFAGRESYFWTMDQRNYAKSPNGKFDISNESMVIQTGYPVLHDPYYFGTLQVTMTFIQDASNELTNEASVMFKFPFVIKSRPKKPIFYVILTGIVMIVGALAVGAFLLYTKRKVVEAVANRSSQLSNIDYKPADLEGSNRLDLG
jgi:hypothetical protein